MKDINIHITNTIGGIRILNLLDQAAGYSVLEALFAGQVSSGWLRLTNNAKAIMSDTDARRDFVKIVGTLVGVRIIKDVTGFNKILSVGPVNLYV